MAGHLTHVCTMSATRNAPDPIVLFRARLTEVLRDDLSIRKIEQDDDGDLLFRYQAKSYSICFDERDSEFLLIRFPGFYSVDARVRRSVVLDACAEATRSVKLVKVYPIRLEDGSEIVSASVELVLRDLDHLDEALIGRCFEAIGVAVQSFFEAMAVANGGVETVEIEVPMPKRRKRH